MAADSPVPVFCGFHSNVAYRLIIWNRLKYMKWNEMNKYAFTFASEFRQNNACALRLWCVKCTNP